jgi:hypothetical protein
VEGVDFLEPGADGLEMDLHDEMGRIGPKLTEDKDEDEGAEAWNGLENFMALHDGVAPSEP